MNGIDATLLMLWPPALKTDGTRKGCEILGHMHENILLIGDAAFPGLSNQNELN